MKEELDVDACLERGDLASITEYLKNHIHRYGRQKTSRELLKDMTGQDSDPYYYVNYLKEKYSGIYGLDRT